MTEKYERLESTEETDRFKVSKKRSETKILFEGTMEQIDAKIESLESALTQYKGWKTELEKLPTA